jgi:hypothetical protein
MTRAIAVVNERASSTEHPGPLRALRERLIGELMADADRAAAVLAADFELTSWTGGTRRVTDLLGRPDEARNRPLRPDGGHDDDSP